VLHLEPGFRTGVNLPWVRYGCDFGANAWQPQGGLGSSGVPDDLRSDLSHVADAGGSLVRWFLFTDGRAGIEFEDDRPAGLDDYVLRDVEEALRLADDLGLDLMFTLFDFHWCHRARIVDGVQLGGRARVLARADLRSALLEEVVAPLLRMAGHHPRVAAWDVINEPEWVTGGVRPLRPWGRVGRGAMRTLIAEVVNLVHELTAHPATVGSASSRWLGLVNGLGLDFYQVHWYDAVEGRGAPDGPAALSVDRPVMLGEFPTRASVFSAEKFFEIAKHAGYFAALPWALRSEDPHSGGRMAVREAIARQRQPQIA
jgi:hypothetical protein